MPGWTAQINGNTAPVRTVDGLFQGVAVPAGEHRVTFSFTPPHETLGQIAFVIGLAWMIAGAVGVKPPTAWRNRSQPARPTSA